MSKTKTLADAVSTGGVLENGTIEISEVTGLQTSLDAKVSGAAASATVGGDLKLYEGTNNGTNFVSFKAPNTLAGNIQWTLPSADGTSGQALITDGSGTLSFTTISGGGGGGGGTSTTTTQFTATGGQTTFNVTYTVGQISVYMNGALLAAADYTATNGTSVVLATGAAAGDIVTVVAYSSVTTVSQGNTNVTVSDSGSNGTIAFTTEGTERARITSSGNLLVNTTSTVSGSNFVVANGDATIYGLTVGRGAGAVATNTAVGNAALTSNTTGSNNTALGINTLRSNTTGTQNTAVGDAALFSNTTASANTAIGFQAALFNTTGANNTAVGYQAAYSNTTGAANTAIGSAAASNASTASGVTAVGFNALTNNTGSNNTAVGHHSLRTNTTGTFNVAVGGGEAGVGFGSLGSNTTGSNNTAVGVQALLDNTTASNNTAVGFRAGISITTGAKNTIIGSYSGNQDGLDIRTASNYAVISDGDGNRLLSMYNGGTLALDGGAVPQSGTGITFPATQSASSDANTLDDYEEGTWTPGFRDYVFDTNSSFTYTSRSGTYTKIGRVVTCYFTATIATASAGNGQAFGLDGLPFAPSSTLPFLGSLATSGVDWPANTLTTAITYFNGNSSNAAIFTATGDNVATIRLASSGVSAGDVIEGSLVYYVA